MSDPIKSKFLSTYDETMKSASPNTDGSGSNWLPPDGEHTAFCIGYTMEPTTFRQQNLPDIPATRIVFHFRLLPVPGDKTPEGVTFSGAAFNMPDEQPSSDKAKTRMKIERDRLAGHLKTLLGSAYVPGIAANFQALDAKLAALNVIPVKVKTSTRAAPGGGNPYRNEHLTENLESH